MVGLIRNITNYQHWRRQFINTVVTLIHEYYFTDSSHNILTGDWDNLVILDACRADSFETVAPIDTFDEYRTIQSVGSQTGEWAQTAFQNHEFGDMVYITANPYVSQHASGSVHELIELWRTEFDDEVKTVKPEAVKQATLIASRKYPHKRIVSHFMQPHHPFIQHAKTLEFSNWDVDKAANSTTIERPHDPFEAVEMGLISLARVQQAYQANLEYVLESVTDLIAELRGRTVVTSDHGNLFGEVAWPVPLRVYGHPAGIRSPELVTVPYAVSDGQRREIVNEGIQRYSATNQQKIKDRLRAFGYRE